MRINLTQNKGYKWLTSNNIYFKGFIISNGSYYSGQDAIQLLIEIDSLIDLKNFLVGKSGMFSIIIEKSLETILATDVTRTFPLFWDENTLEISDDPYSFEKKLSDLDIIKEFQSTGYTLGNKTLFKGILQTESAQVISLSSTKVDTSHHFNYPVNTLTNNSNDAFAETLKDILIRIFQDLLNFTGQKTLVVPLSGGYDSRLIAALLKYHDYKEVVCYTYGVKGNKEAIISEKVAKKLGYKWFFIDYQNLETSGYTTTETFREYVKFSGRANTFPYLQDYFSLKYIRDNNMVPEDSIFLPGHSGDTIAGSHLKNRFSKNSSQRKVYSEILHDYWSLSNVKPSKPSLDKLKSQIARGNGLPHSVFEDWVIRERHVKSVINSASVFDYFGYSYIMPLWDMSLVSFFRSLPLKHKNYKSLYDHVIKTSFFEAFDLNFDQELQPKKNEIILQNYKNEIKKFIPNFFLNKLSDPFQWSAYKELTEPMRNELKSSDYLHSVGRTYNSVIVNWYLNELNKLCQ